MPSLCSSDTQRRSLRLAGLAVGADQELRHDEQRDAAHAGRRVGRARQHQVHDVLGHVVLAVGDEDLLAGDQIVVALLDGAAPELGEVGARLRLGEVHGPGPFARDHLGQEGRLLVGRAVMVDGVDRALVQQQHQAEAHVGRLPHLLHGGGQQPRHALAAELRVEGERIPAAVDELLVDAGKSRGCPHHAVLELGAHLVAVAVERRQAVAGELGRLLEHRIDRVVGRMLVARQRRDLLQSCHFTQRETHIGKRGGIGHLLSSGPQYAALGRFWRPARVFSSHVRHRSFRHRRPARHHHAERSGQAQPPRSRRARSVDGSGRDGRRQPRRAGHGDHRRRREDLLLGLRSRLDPGQRPEAAPATGTRPSRTSWTASRACACRRCAR